MAFTRGDAMMCVGRHTDSFIDLSHDKLESGAIRFHVGDQWNQQRVDTARKFARHEFGEINGFVVA